MAKFKEMAENLYLAKFLDTAGLLRTDTFFGESKEGVKRYLYLIGYEPISIEILEDNGAGKGEFVYDWEILDAFEQIVRDMGVDSSEGIAQRYLELKDIILQKMVGGGKNV